MGQSGDLRIFDADGKYVDTWEIPVSPDAIYARIDGAIFVAGKGQVPKLSPKGAVELKKEAPHFAAFNAHPEKLREDCDRSGRKASRTPRQAIASVRPNDRTSG